MKTGDYVLGMTGGTGDPWAVGYYGGQLGERHIVTHADGSPINGRTYRRVRRVSKERGEWLLANAMDIDRSFLGWGAVLRMSMESEG